MISLKVVKPCRVGSWPTSTQLVSTLLDYKRVSLSTRSKIVQHGSPKLPWRHLCTTETQRNNGGHQGDGTLAAKTHLVAGPRCCGAAVFLMVGFQKFLWRLMAHWCFHFLAFLTFHLLTSHLRIDSAHLKPWLSRYRIIPPNRHVDWAAGIPTLHCCVCVAYKELVGLSGCLAITTLPTLRFRSVVIENDWNKVEWSQVDASGKGTTGYSSNRPTVGVWCFVKKVAVKVEARPTWQSFIIMWLFIIINPST